MLSFTVGLFVGIIVGGFVGLIIMSATAVYRITTLEKELYIYEQVLEDLVEERNKKNAKHNNRRSTKRHQDTTIKK